MLESLSNKNFSDGIERARHIAKLHANGKMVGAELPHQACVILYREKALIS